MLCNQCLQLNITYLSTIFIVFSIFMRFSVFFKEKWIKYAFDTAGPGWFSWKFSLLSGRYTNIIITNCNTVYTTSCKLITRGLLDAELLLKDISIFDLLLWDGYCKWFGKMSVCVSVYVSGHILYLKNWTLLDFNTWRVYTPPKWPEQALTIFFLPY